LPLAFKIARLFDTSIEEIFTDEPELRSGQANGAGPRESVILSEV
jgi:DNA-binding XRE family transcriptional regulator